MSILTRPPLSAEPAPVGQDMIQTGGEALLQKVSNCEVGRQAGRLATALGRVGLKLCNGIEASVQGLEVGILLLGTDQRRELANLHINDATDQATRPLTRVEATASSWRPEIQKTAHRIAQFLMRGSIKIGAKGEDMSSHGENAGTEYDYQVEYDHHGATDRWQEYPADSLPAVEAVSVRDHERSTEGSMAVTLCTDPKSPLWRSAVEKEAEIFMRSGYVGSMEKLAAEYAPYMDTSSMLVLEVDGKVAGASRLISYDPRVGFKTLNDIKSGLLKVSDVGQRRLDSLDPTQTVEIGTIVLDEEHRGVHRRANLALYGAILGIARERHTPNIIASFDGKFLERFAPFFGAVEKLGDEIDYMGSKTAVTFLNVDEVATSLRQRGKESVLDLLEQTAHTIKHEHRPNSIAA